MNNQNKKQIGWIDISRRKYGGGKTYGQRVERILSKEAATEKRIIDAHFFPWKYMKPIEWFFHFLALRQTKDLWITQTYEAVIGLTVSSVKGKRLTIVHHIDNSAMPSVLRPFLWFSEKIFYRNLRKFDAIVTVSRHWEEHFRDRGYTNIYRIHNTVPLERFNIPEEDVEHFKKKFQLEGKPIVYIGNCQKAKGVVDSYEALKELDVHLVTSGERRVCIPAKNLDVTYDEYLRLLKASTIVITMSKFKEGWCVTAHESMLLGTPVIGSGVGGMRELLEGGDQIVCEDFARLRENVEYLLDNQEERKRLGERGYLFVKQFTPDKFEKEWKDLIKKLIG